jgi:hypothetical protein
MKSRFRRAACPKCESETEYDATAARLSPVKDIECTGCGTWFRPEAPARVRGNDNQKRSKQQEKRAAARYDARVQPASGSMAGAKSDIRKKGVLRGECKFTRAAAFSLKLFELLKVEQEAAGGELPLFEVEFQGVYPVRRFVVLRAEDYAALKSENESLAALRKLGMVE